ncbi:hypothetical protein ACWGST_00285 [Agromyces sp. NPDC055520]
MSLPRLAPRRQRDRLGIALAAAGAIALLMSGCTGADPAPSPSPSPSADAAGPIFASDEEALAAAVEAYEAYREVSDTILIQGGEEADRIDTVVTTEFAPKLHEEYAAIEDLGLSSSGPSSFDTTSLVEWRTVDGVAEVSIYLCRDVSGSRVIDANGTDVTPAQRPDRIASQAFMVSAPGEPALLIVSGVNAWSGDDFC